MKGKLRLANCIIILYARTLFSTRKSETVWSLGEKLELETIDAL